MKLSMLAFLLFSWSALAGATTDVSKSASERTKPVVQVRMSDIGLGDPLEEDIRASHTELPEMDAAGLPAKQLEVSFARVQGAMPFIEAGLIKDMLEEAHRAGVDLPSDLKTTEDVAALKAGAESLPAQHGELKARLVAFANAISTPAADRFDALGRFFGEQFRGPVLKDYRPFFTETAAATAARSAAKIKTFQMAGGMAISGAVDEYNRLSGDLSLVHSIIRGDLASKRLGDAPFKLVLPSGIEPSSLRFEPDLIEAVRSGRLKVYAVDNMADATMILSNGASGRGAQAPAFPADIVLLPPVSGEDAGVTVRGPMSQQAAFALEAAMRRVGALGSGIKLEVENSTLWGDNPQISISVDGRPIYREYLYSSEENLARARRSGGTLKGWLYLGRPSQDLSKRFEAALLLAREIAKEATRTRATVRLSSPAESIMPVDASPTLKEVLTHFWELSKIYRPSKGEDAARNYVIELASGHGRRMHTDAAGNLLVLIPGTGRFAGSKRALALQSHLDMVLDAEPETIAAAGGLPAVFRDGVHLVASDGWIHSKDNATTIGADNGIGVAMMLRYATDDSIEHPPLELIFTVDEETGMTGAKALELPITAHALINLDNEEFGKIGVGSLGIVDGTVRYAAPKAKIPADFERFTLSLSGLKGGHSGGDIHLGRGNTVRILAEMIRELQTLTPEAFIVGGSAGTRGVANKIPSALTLSFAAPPGQEAALRAWLSDFQRRLEPSLSASGETSSLKVAFKPASAGTDYGLAVADAEHAASALLKIPDGVIQENAAYPNRVELSSNLGFLWLEPGDSAFDVEYGVMPRSFTEEPLTHFADKTVALAKDVRFESSVETSRFPAWTPDLDSPLLHRFLAVAEARFGRFQPESVPGGLETAFFRRKFPDMQLVSIGPDIKDAHSRHERVEIEAISKTIELLDAFLASPDAATP